MSGYYTLRGREVVPASDLMDWTRWFERGDWRVKQERAVRGQGPRVSTVFLGIDHNFLGGPPLVFETMIFGGRRHEYQQRYSTYDEAERGHRRALQLARVWRGGRRTKLRTLKKELTRSCGTP